MHLVDDEVNQETLQRIAYFDNPDEAAALALAQHWTHCYVHELHDGQLTGGFTPCA
jgi:hypothetical protein